MLRELDRMDDELVATIDHASPGAIDTLRTERVEMRRVLDLVDDLGYGVCDECRGFIGIERLMALPTTRRCIAHAR